LSRVENESIFWPLKKAWIAMSDRAEAEIIRVADTMPQIPIGVAFVDEKDAPGWIGSNPALHMHRPSIRGCWPHVSRPDNPDDH